eukprot:TRINITY_DN5167_c0_g1_i1.p1 TRINITY_DN5167_c0_g1~~TRINITY_DN5167_c0_g1_i1.p1  ORF type:complete len:417 (-),score=67.72 TRINITY_DN5167_c0_g1_i1:35-1285(-)
MTTNLMNHSLFYYENGDLYSCGYNQNYQLGLGDNNDRSTPSFVLNDKDIKMISNGNLHSMYLKENGELYYFGCKNDLEYLLYSTVPELMMNGNCNSPIKDIKCGAYSSIIYHENGEIYYRGQLELGVYEKNFKLIDTRLGIKNIICGGFFVIIHCDDGEVLVYGRNDYGQLGFESVNYIFSTPIVLMKDSSIKKICCGWYYTIFLKENGEVWGMGDNQYGQLGLMFKKQVKVPTLLLKDANIRDIYCGSHTTYILYYDGTLKSSGYNADGQLGLGHVKNQSSFKEIFKQDNIRDVISGWGHVFVCFYNNDIKIFGCNTSGQFGTGFLESHSKPFFYKNIPSLKILLGGKPMINTWSINDHKGFGPSFNLRVKILLLCFKRINKKYNFKIPKPISHLIISNMDNIAVSIKNQTCVLN